MAEEETMEAEEETVEATKETIESPVAEEVEVEVVEEIIKHLIECEEVFFKSQQRGEEDLTAEEKKDIARKIWRQSKSAFLCRFGRHLREEHLEHFQQFAAVEAGDDGYAVTFYLADLRRFFSRAKRERDVRNRRYDALKRLAAETEHFSEREMMRRNPLLYEQLVGQYLSDEEKKKRDNIDTNNITFVNLLLESIDRDSLRKKQREQRDVEECTMEEEEDENGDEDGDQDKKDIPMKEADSDSWDEETTDKVTKWGEFPGSSSSYVSSSEQIRRYDHFFSNSNEDASKKKNKEDVVMITATERHLLKEEFISIMYQDFLDGKDPDFDYSTVDDNEEYDNLELKTHDAEDSYFDSETPEDVPPNIEALSMADEDELDLFMNRLNKQLSHKMNNL